MIIDKIVVKTGSTCTLKCAKCGEFNPYLPDCGKSFHCTALQLFSDIVPILDAVDNINTIHIAGGEPFTHSDVGLLACALCAIPKIRQVEIVTNGTIVPSEVTLLALASLGQKVLILISDYRGAGVNNNELIKALQINKINYKVFRDMTWVDKSDTSFKDYTQDDLKEIAQKCSTFRQRYFSLIDGIITAHCPTSGSLLYYLDKQNEAAGYFFDVRKSTDIEKDLLGLENTLDTPMCRYCTPTYLAHKCVAGEQLRRI